MKQKQIGHEKSPAPSQPWRQAPLLLATSTRDDCLSAHSQFTSRSFPSSNTLTNRDIHVLFLHCYPLMLISFSSDCYDCYAHVPPFSPEPFPHSSGFQDPIEDRVSSGGLGHFSTIAANQPQVSDPFKGDDRGRFHQILLNGKLP